jgi:hypothetical protein
VSDPCSRRMRPYLPPASTSQREELLHRSSLGGRQRLIECVSWKCVVMDTSSVTRDERRALDDGRHLLSMTLFAWFSGFGSRNTNLAASLSLRRGTRFSSHTRETRRGGGDRMSGFSSGSLRAVTKSCTETGCTVGELATEGGVGSVPWTSDDGPSLLFCCPSLATALTLVFLI